MFSKQIRNNSLKIYELCPGQYLSAPALSWDAMFNMAKVDLELIPDPDMLIFFEKVMIGNISYIYNRYSEANNKCLKGFNQTQESKLTIDLDANNVCGYAMSKFLPTSRFKWITRKEFDLNKYTSNSSKGCVLQVDIEYQKDLRELHSNCPLALDKIEIKKEMLSNYQLRIAYFNNIPIGNVKKFVANLFDKEKYVLHYENLQLYLRLGLKLKKYIAH